ncbi:tigger transposable element-derived protein 4-like [Penaeus indicus]|uniref:tigger transposable element-derived protein 4-like n=1 Tax=Penaeus indicus TaxID=29960 RepID=UPI00300C523A
MSAVKRKLNNTKLIKKCQIIREVAKGMTNKEASEKSGVPKSTISTWMENKEKLLQGLEQSSSEAKKIRGCDFEQVDKAVQQWFTLLRGHNVPVDGQMLKEKALQFPKSFDFPTFKASDGWLDKWKKSQLCYISHRDQHISLKTIGGEFKSVTPQMTCSWNETTLPTILSNYKLEDIFNADEFGLFYQCLPDKTYHFTGETCSGGRKAKAGLPEWLQQVRKEKNCLCS